MSQPPNKSASETHWSAVVKRQETENPKEVWPPGPKHSSASTVASGPVGHLVGDPL